MKRGDYNRAIADYTEAARINPSNAEAYGLRGLTYFYKGEYDRAIADCTEAVRLAPDYIGAYHNRGNAYFKKEEYDKAIADFTETIKFDPNDAAAYNDRGIAYFEKGEYDRAIADFTDGLYRMITPNIPRKSKMRNIVLITWENSERVTHVSVIFCHDYHEAAKLCHLVNRLFGAGNEKLIARCISTGREYCLEKGSMFNYDDLVKLDDRTIQKIMREISSEVLIPALFDSSEAIRERFLSNMSKRAAGMLLEDMEYSVPACESEIEEAKQHILDAYDYVLHEAKGQREFQSIFDKYEKETEKQNGTDSQDKYLGEKYIALVFRGKKEIAETVSAVGFDSMETQVNFCEFITDKNYPMDHSFLPGKRNK
jgi:tetratricopeptide (TPR) repeat protein